MSFSLSFGTDSSDDWRIFVSVERSEPVMLHKVHKHLPELLRLKTLKERVATDGVIATHILAAVNYSSESKGFKYRHLDIADLHDRFVHGEPQYVHELFLNDRKVKPFFDLDVKVDHQLSPEEEDSFCRRFANHCSRTLGFSSDLDCYTFVQTIYPDSPDKFSVHVIVNDGSVFQSAQTFGRWLTNIELFTREVPAFGVDLGIYKSTCSLRAVGSTKWVKGQAACPAIIRGVCNTDCTRQMFESALAQCVPVNHNLIRVEGHSQGVRQTTFYEAAQRDREGVAAIVIEKLETDRRNQALEASAFSSVEGRVMFNLDTAGGWGRCSHPLKVIVHPCDMAMLQCQAEECGDQWIGLTDVAQGFYHNYEYMMWLHHHNLDRPDMIIFNEYGDRRFGHYAITAEDFFAKVRKGYGPQHCEWCAGEEGLPPFFGDFILDERDSTACNFQFFEFLRAFTHNSENVLSIYLNFFICRSEVKDCLYVRGNTGLVQQRSDGINKSYAKFQLEVVVPSRKKDEPDGSKMVPFLKRFYESRHFRNFGGENPGDLDFGPRANLNVQPPTATDFNRAYLEFHRSPKVERDFLGAIWDAYLNMAVAYEPAQNQQDARDALERWVFEVVFNRGSRTQVCPILCSKEGGQGKSTLGNLVIEILGSDLATVQSAKSFFNTNFNAGTNGFIMLDEVAMNHNESESFKSAITAPTVRMESKGSNAFSVPSQRNFFCTTNKDFVIGVNPEGNMRRFLILRFKSREQLDDARIFAYQCDHCDEEDDYGDKFRCAHCFESHAEWIALIYQQIISGKDGNFQRGQFFMPFVGMLYERYICNKHTYIGAMCNSIPLTVAGQEMQAKGVSLARQFIEDCCKRGYHSSLLNTPYDYSRNKTYKVLYPRELVTAHSALDIHTAKPIWHEYATWSQLHFEFTQYCAEQHTKSIYITNKKNFEAEIRLLHSTMCKVPLETEKKECQYLEFKANYQTDPYWQASSNPTREIDVIKMGEKPWTEKSPERVPSSAELLGPPKKMELHRSASNLGQFASPIMSYASPPQNTTDIAAQYDGQDGPSILKRAMALAGSSDARDGFLPIFQDESEPDSEDENEMDRLAAEADVHARKRERAVSKYLDIAAVEDSHQCHNCGAWGATKKCKDDGFTFYIHAQTNAGRCVIPREESD